MERYLGRTRLLTVFLCTGVTTAVATAQTPFATRVERVVFPQKQSAAEKWSWPLWVNQCGHLESAEYLVDPLTPIPDLPDENQNAPPGENKNAPPGLNQNAPPVGQNASRKGYKYPTDHRAYTWKVEYSPNPAGPFPSSWSTVATLSRTIKRVGDYPGAPGTGSACAPGPFRIRGAGLYRVTLSIRRGGGLIASRADSPPIVSSDTVRVDRVLLFASMGDSYASGEGNPTFKALTKIYRRSASFGGLFTDGVNEDTFLIGAGLCEKAFWRYEQYADGPMPADRTETWDLEDSDWRSTTTRHGPHRSTGSGPARASGLIGNPRDLVAFVSVASSGAEIQDGMLSAQSSPSQPRDQFTALRAVVGTRPIDILTISIGGNDVGFSNTLATLVSQTGGRRALMEKFGEDIPKLRENYNTLRARVDALLNPTRVYLTEYPVGLFNGSDGIPKEGCGMFDNTADIPLPGPVDPIVIEAGPVGKIDILDARLILNNGKTLNNLLAEKALEFGWKYVDGIHDGFSKHGYCSGQRWFRGATESCKLQADFRGVLHPNDVGHKFIAQQIARAINADIRALRRLRAP